MKHLILIGFLLIFISGCASSIPAPVESRGGQNNKNRSSTSVKHTSKDWRPDSYTIKSGDTLYSIGLEHGLDYREIAAANNIYEPYTINIGQKLSLTSLKVKETSAETNPSAYENEDGVIISPIDTESGVTASTDATAESTVTPVLTEPKAVREPYSKEALNRKTTPKQPTTVTTLPSTPTVKQPANKVPSSTKKSVWAWPTQGKIIERFNAAKNKGIDIAGKKGQSIKASAAGKVIYAGSDLRGYGKLVIIKHNKTYLSVYAHNSKIIVKEGQVVKAGQKIAAMGSTDTNTVKLHFEIRERGKSVDPGKFLPQN
ncbi:MAG: peptidoglycan DD-metalloendopeptidase family protein [Methylophilaceae bacterium]